MLNNNDFKMNGNNLAKAQHAIDSIILQLKQEAIHMSDFMNCHWLQPVDCKLNNK